ncbi:twin-arginine translocase subunit TatC [bacterium]|nr:twin-arginine translocase subunit TatC [bacterium]
METYQEQSEPVRLQSLVEHLGDLRAVLIRSAVAVVIAFFASFHYADRIIAFLKAPLLSALPEHSRKLYYMGLTEQLYCYMKVSLFAALAFSFPFLLTQLWIFIAPALKKNEKRLVVPFIVASISAFILGFFCAYRWGLPYVFQFLLSFSPTPDEVPLIRLSDYLTLVLQLLLGTALLFEIPVLLSLLGKLGIINAALLKHYRPQAYVGLAILAAVLTPTPDAFSMILALIPLFFLYELSVFCVQWVASENGGVTK